MTMDFKKISLIATDLAFFFTSFLLSVFVRQSVFVSKHFANISFETVYYLASFLIASLLLLAIFSAFKLYQVRQVELSARIFTVLKALAVWTFTMAAIIYVIKFDFSRGIFFMTVIFTVILICCGRYFLFKRRHDRSGGEGIEVTIIGTGNRAKSIEKQIKEVLPNSTCKKYDYAVPETRSYLASLASADIFVADEHLSREEVLSMLVDEKFSHHSFRVVLDVFRLVTGEIHLNDIDEIPSIASRNKPHTAYQTTKRLIDIFVASFGLVITSPLWILISIIIKIDSKGPVLIKQIRIGWNGEPFTIYKFRTMRQDVSLYDLAPKDEGDRRITKIGKILRRFSFDEFPQLWNILKGEMSLVGPRPEMEFLVNNYAPWQRFRLKAKPGLTGLWQILGRKDIPLNENLEYDFYYVCNRSFLLDSVIILKTVPSVLFGRGAY
jgi:exopolysaccharide biosynthesis polyprenyl glycosylphosphotransferase